MSMEDRTECLHKHIQHEYVHQHNSYRN